ncbi:MAG: VCBS repeat-containing protein [Bacteroidales bacterium]|nr:VCBS repeat-containing protein [Bacteroidales bacterium]
MNNRAPGSDIFNLITDQFCNINAGYFSKPTICNYDEDGLLDLFIGEKYGAIRYYEQTSVGIVDFNLVELTFGGVDVGNDAAPLIYDIDQDGLLDIVCGEWFGGLTLFVNYTLKCERNEEIGHYGQTPISPSNSGQISPRTLSGIPG